MEQDSLFQSHSTESPLAERMRPQQIGGVVGQEHFLNSRFQRMIETDRWAGLIFWGPPGTGKTTLANTIARKTQRSFKSLSAVTAGVKEIREVLDHSRGRVRAGLKAEILFIDEVHRLNKAQQDVLLPYLESGDIRFIGATTENPSFEINNAIASRCIIFHFEALSHNHILTLLKKAAEDNGWELEEVVFDRIASAAMGDARRALTLLEHLTLSNASQKLTEKDFDELSLSQSLYYDKKSESHYDTISAFIKSVRGSDPDAAVYYLARMLESGEDPMFVARRLIILASEDIGNANPMALVLASQGAQSVHMVGMPEARIILSQITIYLACSEKSNRSYLAIGKAIDEVKRSGHLEIPLSIRNAPTKLMKDMGYGKDYEYAHNSPGARSRQKHLPESLQDKVFFNPSNRGVEERFQKFLGRESTD